MMECIQYNAAITGVKGASIRKSITKNCFTNSEISKIVS